LSLACAAKAPILWRCVLVFGANIPVAKLKMPDNSPCCIFGGKPSGETGCASRLSTKSPEENAMAKGQVRGNREAKKPKKEKPKVTAAAPPVVRLTGGDQKKK
jgi:hypothetical protein